MGKICKKCQTPFEVNDSDLAFYKKVSPVIAGQRYDIPAPPLCPECRLQRRMAWRNDRNLYTGTCDKTGEPIISMFHPDTPVTVIKSSLWWGDSWDAKDYGMPFDFSRLFFDQLGEILQKTPLPNLATPDCENSPYANYAYKNKNCYLCFAGNYLEDSYYCYNAENSRDCVDCLFTHECENCYELVHCNNCYNVKYSVNSRNCSESWFLQDCRSLRNCFMCFNVDNKEYHILNQPHSKEEYEKILESYQLNTQTGIEKAKQLFLERRNDFGRRENQNFMTENCDGEYISQSRNCHQCFIMQKKGEDCKYAFNGFPIVKDAMDLLYAGENAELLYECTCAGGGGQRIIFGNVSVLNCENVAYCHWTVGSKNCFGCVGLHKGKYCILNKQYSQADYEALVPKIIEHMRQTGEWGEFSDPQISPFAYNETLAQEYFPLTKETALAQGFTWSDYERPKPQAKKSIPAEKLPDNTKDIPDDILNWAVLCQETGKPFKIIAQELKFYRKHNLPIPRLHPDVRHANRVKLRNPRPKWN